MDRPRYRYFIFSCFEWSLSVTLLLTMCALFFVIADGKMDFYLGLGLMLSLESLYLLSVFFAIASMRYWCATCHRDVGIDETGVRHRELFCIPLTRCRACHFKLQNNKEEPRDVSI